MHYFIYDCRPILFAIETPSYKLAKSLVPKLSSIAFNEFTVKDSFAFAEGTVHKESKSFLGSLDAEFQLMKVIEYLLIQQTYWSNFYLKKSKDVAVTRPKKLNIVE